jgi:replication factor C large subunit
MRLREIVGNQPVIHRMVDWAKTWTPASKPLLLYGKAGIGKTSSAHALARDMNWDVLELNASDQRTRDAIDRVAGAGSMSGSLTGQTHRLIILDEADNLHGTADAGGARAILGIIRTSVHPIILIANDAYGITPDLRFACEPLQFKALPNRSIVPHLRGICAREGVSCSDKALHTIADASSGDLRLALNMLSAASSGKDSLTDDDIISSGKDARATIFSLIPAIFSSHDDGELLRLSREVDDTPDAVLQWIEGMVPGVLAGERMYLGYRCLSRADEYLGNTFRAQYYTLWRYASALMVLGVASASGGRGFHTRITPPDRWKRQGAAKKQRVLRISLLSRVASRTHIPVKALREEYMGPLTLLIDASPEPFVSGLSLDVEELNLFLHDRSRSQEILKAFGAGGERGGEKVADEGPFVQKRGRGRPKSVAKTSPPNASAPPPIEKTKEVPVPEERTVPDGKKSPAQRQKTLFEGF